jgi:hypothetical protein
LQAPSCEAFRDFRKETLACGVEFSYGMKHELPDADERLSRQHVLPYAHGFWHWELIDRLQVSKSCRTHCQTAVGFVL